MPICAGLLITFLSRFHFERNNLGGMSAIGTKQTSVCAASMSALEVKRTKVYGDLNFGHRLGSTVFPLHRRPISASTAVAPPCAGLVVGASAQKTEFVCASSQTFRSTSAIIRMRHLHRRPTCEEY